MPPKEEIKQIKAEALARPITVVEPAANDGGKKRHSLPVQETSVEKKPKIVRRGSLTAKEVLAEKKPKTSSAACERSPAAPKLVIDLTSPGMGKKRLPDLC